jgi:hypothetical protein
LSFGAMDFGVCAVSEACSVSPQAANKLNIPSTIKILIARYLLFD